MKENTKKVYLKSWGCQMNVRDSEVICGLLKNAGYEITDEPDGADIILFNTCSVRQHAEDKVWSEIGRFKVPPSFAKAKLGRGDDYPDKKIIGVIGCMAQNYKEKIFERAPNVDFVVGPSDIDKIPGIIRKLSATRYQLSEKKGQFPTTTGSPERSRGKNGDSPFFPLYATKIWETDGQIRPDEIYRTGFYEDKSHAYVVISEGCSNYCSYCVVPYVRGELRNRNYKDILSEIEEAIAKGITRITLLGQNVNTYKRITEKIGTVPKNRGQSLFSQDVNGNVYEEDIDFIKLLELVNKAPGLKEFSFITSHPKDTSLDLFRVMADLEKLKKYLHLPVQSGSDRVLELMNRGYTKRFYLDLIDNYRKIVKDAILTTDIIVGFPNETQEDFQDTFNLVRDIQFDAAYIFKYSSRAHTEAEKLADDVPKKEKERRHSMILELQKETSRKRKVQSEKRKVKTQSSKFLVLSFGFALCALSFALPCYALNLDSVKVYFLNGDYKQAILEGEKILATASHSASGLDGLYYMLGVSYLKDGNYLRASDIFEIILKEFKESKFKEEARLGLADTYFLRGDYNSAETQYEQLLRDNPRSKLQAIIFYRLSQCHAKKGDIQKAKEYSDRLKQESPLNLEVRLQKELSYPSSYYTVQLGSFSNLNNAKNLMRKLIQKGYDAYIEESSFYGRAIYRVRVAKLQQYQQVKDLEKKLSQEGYPTKIYP